MEEGTSYYQWLHALTVYLYKYDVVLTADEHTQTMVKGFYDDNLSVEDAAKKIMDTI